MPLHVDSAWIAVALQFVGMLIAGVWFVSRLTATGERLSAAIDRLDKTMEKMDVQVNDHEIRLTRVESRHP